MFKHKMFEKINSKNISKKLLITTDQAFPVYFMAKVAATLLNCRKVTEKMAEESKVQKLD